MKTIKYICQSAVRLCFAVALGSLLRAPLTSSAQSPRGAEKLLQLKTVATVEDLQTLEAGDTLTMSCPKCKTTWIKTVEKTFKAVQPEELKTMQVQI